jgi:hypothetical protein
MLREQTDGSDQMARSSSESGNEERATVQPMIPIWARGRIEEEAHVNLERSSTVLVYCSLNLYPTYSHECASLTAVGPKPARQASAFKQEAQHERESANHGKLVIILHAEQRNERVLVTDVDPVTRTDASHGAATNNSECKRCRLTVQRHARRRGQETGAVEKFEFIFRASFRELPTP